MINGYKNEYDFINYLNNKSFNELNILMQEVIETLFPDISNSDIITAYKYGRHSKADIVVSVNDVRKGISIKSGHHNSVHIESIERFTEYLSQLGINKKLIDIFLYYIYSDGSNNNTGTDRISNSLYIEKNKEDIILLNRTLNMYKSFFIKRFLIDTYVDYKVKADLFIHGTLNDFVWATASEIQSYLETIKYDSNSVHSSKLFIQNWNKNLQRNNKYEHCRNYIQVKWYSIYDDIISIMANR